VTQICQVRIKKTNGTRHRTAPLAGNFGKFAGGNPGGGPLSTRLNIGIELGHLNVFSTSLATVCALIRA
jgi:hypothetical protein